MVYIINLGTVRRAYDLWARMFPTIQPFYAVKCCPDPRVIETLAELGAGFDCASPHEVRLVRKGEIIYANPCKNPKDLETCRMYGVTTTTFDSMNELEKISRVAPNMNVVLRIKADDPLARCPMGNKFGAVESEWGPLAEEAKRLNLRITGVSFHVGSFAQSPDAHALAIQKAARAFALLKSKGHNPELLDIGGGFSTETLESIHPACSAINNAIQRYGFKNVIAEPGRFFVEHAVELHTKVIGVKPDSITIDDSLYGAFNCIVMDHAKPTPLAPLGCTPRTIFGCTCDGLDVIGTFPVAETVTVGDTLIWPRMGAYTMAASTNFNGLGFDGRQRIYTI